MNAEDLTSAAAELDALTKKKDVQALLAAAAKGPAAIRARATEALGSLGSGAAKGLAAAQSADDPALRLAAASASGRLVHKDREKLLLASLADAAAPVRREAASGLGQVPSKKSIQALNAALDDDSSAVRCAAARSLRHLSTGDADALATMTRSRYGTLRSASLAALIASKATVEADVLTRPLSDASRAIRRHAVALGTILSPPHPKLARGLRDKCPLVRREAAAGMAPNEANLAALATALRTDPDPETRRAAVHNLGRHLDDTIRAVLARALEDLDPEVREAASAVLAEQSEDENAILATHWVSQEQWDRCIEAGKSAEPALIGAATRAVANARDRANRQGAIRTLGRMQAVSAVKPLLATLGDGDGRIRASALEALGKIGKKSVLAAALTHFDDPDAKVRAAALGCAAAVGDASTAERIAAGLDDLDTVVRNAAVRALGRLGALDRLAKLVRAPEIDVRIEALAFLGDTGRPDAIAPVLRGLADSRPVVRQAAEAALRRLDWLPIGLPSGDVGGGYGRWLGRRDLTDDKDTRPAIVVIRESTSHSRPLYRRAALEALQREHDHDGLSAIRKCLTDLDPAVRMTAAIACAALGDEPTDSEAWAAYHISRQDWDLAASLGKTAVAPLAHALMARRPADRRSAALALGRTDHASAACPLLNALADADAVVRRAAVEALGQLNVQSSIEAVVARLDDPDERVSSVAIEVLASFGKPAADSCLTALTTLGDVGRTGAATVLGRLSHKAALDTLVDRMTWDPSPAVRAASAASLAAVGDSTCIDALIGALGDAFKGVRDAAEASLTACGWTSDPAIYEAARRLALEHWDAVKAIGPVASPLLIGCLSDTARDTRSNRRRPQAARLLGQFQSADARPLLEACLTDIIQEVRWESAAALER
ncbi:MAG: HEAT repeat protein, partial [Myxococcota bacterium]